MAFDSTPTTHLTGWSEDATDITVPLATFPELTAAEADAATGDIRKIVFAVVEKFYQAYAAMAGNKPVKMRIYRDSQVNDAAGTLSRSYRFEFDCTQTNITGQEVAAEA